MNRDIISGGERIALARMTEEDQPSFHAWQQNPELRRLIDDPRVPTMDDQLRWFARAQEPDRRMFSLVTLPEHRLIGHGGFVDIASQKRTAQFRITIGDPEAWGQGYGTEATRLVLRYGFKELGFMQIWLRVRNDNTRAIRSYEKVGFQRAGPEEGNPEILRMTIEVSQVLH